MNRVMMAAKTSWHGYGTKLRHGHPMYSFKDRLGRDAAAMRAVAIVTGATC